MRLASGYQAPRAAGLNTRQTDAQRIARSLDRCPLWTDVAEHDIHRRQSIIRLYERLTRFDTGTIRVGASVYLSAHGSAAPQFSNAREKIFAFVRVVFAEPERIPRNNQSFGLLGNPRNSADIDLSWPFSIDNLGHLALTGADPRMHGGLPYDALSDFDVRASAFERGGGR